MDNYNKLKGDIKLKIAISEIDDEESDITMNKKKNFISSKIGLVACACLILTTGVVFAKDIENYIKSLFNNSTEAVDAAVENGYVQKEEMDYVYDKDIGIKVDNLVLDDLNLDVLFNFEIKRENVKSIRFKDFIITNDNDKVVFRSEFKYAETLEELPLYNSVNWMNEPQKLTDTTFADSILFGLRPEKEDFKELYFDVKSIDVMYTDDKKEVIEGNWKFNVTINDEMKQSTTTIYTMGESNEYIESCKATMSNTGTIIELTSKEKILVDEYIFIGEMISLSSDNATYKSSFIEYGENSMKIHFDNVGNFIENSDRLELHLDFFNTIVVLIKENI